MSELKYKVGDEVLIRGKIDEIIDEIDDPTTHMYPYRVMYEYNNMALAWSEHVTESSIAGKADEFVKVEEQKADEFVKVEEQKAYEQGMNDIWAAALVIADDLSHSTLADMYDGYCTLYDILHNFSAKDAFARYAAWKKAKNEEYKLRVDAQRSTVEDLKKQYEHELGVLNAMLEELEK